KLKREAATDKQVLARYDNSLDSLQTIYDLEVSMQKERIQSVAQQYILDHWNAAHLDVAVGKLYSYENAALDSLKLRAGGSAIWVNGSLPIGKRLMLNGTVKYMKQVAQDSFSTRINTTSGGVGMRYGSPKFTFFVEFVFSKFKSENNISFEEMPELNMAQLNNFSTSYGGDWRINRNVLLSYGVRLDHSDGYHVKNIIPVAGVSCMMR
ncbi:MAG: hypothetical protein IT258_17505, partial [Saprospiraceae bacterium]|nr:hypothetical protein [Saprospiraceae bacterium]